MSNEYLEPQAKYNGAIIESKSNITTYCFHELVNMIMQSIDNSCYENEEHLLEMATEIFWRDLYQEKNENISFRFIMDDYFVVKACMPNNTYEYVKSSTYPGKLTYHSRKSAESAIKKYHIHHFPEGTTFEIEKMKDIDEC